jgi:hypothetical protein
MIGAGVPQMVTMSISGHRTTAMFNRYNISSDDDRRNGLRRTRRQAAEEGTQGGRHRHQRFRGRRVTTLLKDSFTLHAQTRRKTQCNTAIISIFSSI